MEVKENTSRSRGEDKEERDNVGGSGYRMKEKEKNIPLILKRCGRRECWA